MLCFLSLLIGCQGNQHDSEDNTDSVKKTIQSEPYTPSTGTTTYSKSTEGDEDSVKHDDNDSDEKQSKIADGTYSATVDYSNPNTGYTATYTLDVEVQDGQVIQIDFPNGGYLDDDHITPADIDEDGNASVDGEDGKTYEVHIDL